MSIKLPISKSIANRILLLQAINGDELMPVAVNMPDDVIVLHDALQKIREVYGTPGNKISLPLGRAGVGSLPSEIGEGLTLHLKNCGTALRFLEVHLEKCYPGEPITLTGDSRLMERKGKPTSQTASARILHGEDIPVTPDESPYITMTRKVMEMYKKNSFTLGRDGVGSPIEADWSAAAFWYEYVAVHGGELLLEDLTADSIQGDRIVADIYAEHFGVTTSFTAEGALLQAKPVLQQSGLTAKRSYSEAVTIDFSNCIDLYPAIALTCERLGIELHATGTERLRYKESDRLEAVRLHEVRNDHRIAMALMASGAYPLPLPKGKGEEMQRIVAKSYPSFVEQISTLLSGRDGVGYFISHITPQRGVNDDNLGKKHALSKLIHASTAEYLWLHDDDVVWPLVCQPGGRSVSEAVCQCNGLSGEAGLVILPLRMESSFPSGRDGVGLSLLEQLQIAEYAAIQELTMRTAKRGKAVMCSGANLIVRREAWLACEAELHPEIPSGDDMFLLEAAKRRGFKIGVLDEPAYTAVVRPQTSWRAFWLQRMRWAGKAPEYTDRDIRRCGALVVTANILQLICPLIILIKFPIEYSLILKREPRTPWYVALLLEIIYPYYLLISLIGGLFRQQQW